MDEAKDKARFAEEQHKAPWVVGFTVVSIAPTCLQATPLKAG